MKIPEAKRAILVEQWTAIIEEQKASGMKIKPWCEKRGIKDHQFYYWQRIVRRNYLEKSSSALVKADTPTLVKVNMENAPDEQPKEAVAVSAAQNEPQFIRLQFKGSVLEIPAGSRAEDISEILRAVSLLC